MEQIAKAGRGEPERRLVVLQSILRRLRSFALLFVLLLLWQFYSTRLLDELHRTLLPPPTAVLAAGWELLSSGELFMHAWASLRRELIAFSWACVAIPLGIAMGWSRLVEEQVDTLMEILRPIPPLAWIPLSILWFGIGDTQNQFIIFLAIFFPILVNTVTGVKNVEPNLIRAARCLGANEAKVLSRVVLRAALPQVMTGVRVGLGVGWMALVAAELVGANSGLGFLINDARTVLRTDYIMVGMASIGIIGLLMDVLVRTLIRKVTPWNRGRT